MFPNIDSPCPLKSIQLPQSGNFNCGQCKREVHNLDAFSEQQRVEFLSQCEGKVCVSYSVKKQAKRVAVAGLFVVTAGGLALPAAAQTADDLESDFYVEVMVGGVNNPKLQALENSSVDSDSKASGLELIPTVEEDSDV